MKSEKNWSIRKIKEYSAVAQKENKCYIVFPFRIEILSATLACRISIS